MNIDDRHEDPVLAAVEGLRTYDLSQRRTHQLRTRCHAVLQARSQRHAPAEAANGTGFGEVIGPALGGAWCLVYLVEVVRRAAAMYGR